MVTSKFSLPVILWPVIANPVVLRNSEQKPLEKMVVILYGLENDTRQPFVACVNHRYHYHTIIADLLQSTYCLNVDNHVTSFSSLDCSFGESKNFGTAPPSVGPLVICHTVGSLYQNILEKVYFRPLFIA